jgi:transcriptional regulator NrdR family protein
MTEENKILEKAFDEIMKTLKKIKKKQTSIKALTNEIFPYLEEYDKAKIMVFTSILIKLEKDENISYIPQYIN